ncbi:MAG: hypothetical protein MZV63_37300 [Marinilabiliales bacterium]|nr:hypothetical protein [Marinilabiliales bacterium]
MYAVLTYDLVFFGNLEIIARPATGPVHDRIEPSRPRVFRSQTCIPGQVLPCFFLTMLAFIGGAIRQHCQEGSNCTGSPLPSVRCSGGSSSLFVSGKVLLPFRIEGRVIPKATAELEAAKNMLVIILSVVVIFIATLAVLQFHLTTFSITDIVFDVVSAFSTCGIEYRVCVPGYADHFKMDLYRRDVGRAAGSDPGCDALYCRVQGTRLTVIPAGVAVTQLYFS